MSFLSWLFGIPNKFPRSIRKKRYLVVYHFEREFEAWSEFSLLKLAVGSVLADVAASRIRFKEIQSK
jgi:hypothetical protein